MKITCLLIVLIFILGGCIPEDVKEQEETPFFDLEGYIEEQAKILKEKNASLKKKASLNGKEEKQEISDVNWGKELEPFANADINKPAWYDQYIADTSDNTITYSAIDQDLSVQQLKVRKSNNVIHKILIKKKTENFLYESKETLLYIPGEKFLISGEQKVQFLSPDIYEVSGKIQ